MKPGNVVQRLARKALRSRRVLKPSLPLHGFVPDAASTPKLDKLSDGDLQRLNGLLPWSCFTVDGRGRRFGDAAWTGKRDTPQQVPDRRALILDDHFGLADKHVLEVGCLEGVHTIGLCRLAAHVTAVDGRVENAVKTVVRCAFYGVVPDVVVCDVEDKTAMCALQADVVHHLGVLYHLEDPAGHLLALEGIARLGLLLDTHVARKEETTDVVVVDGQSYPFKRYREGGAADVFSGLRSHAKWLTLDGVVDLLGKAGFGASEILEERDERNGRRVLLVAKRQRRD